MPHLGLRAQQPRALFGGERRQRRRRELVGDAVELAHLGPAGARQAQARGPAIDRVGPLSTRPSRSSERIMRER